MDTRSANSSGATTIRRWALLLLAFSAIPDVLPYAGLKSLISERFEKSEAESQLFAIVALIGALLAVLVLRRVRKASPRRVFMACALLQATVIGLMILPINWSTMLVLRGVQGGADLLMLVTLTTVVASHAKGTGRGFGAAGAAILFGLAFGLLGGGILTSFEPGSVFPVSVGISLMLAGSAFGLPSRPLHATPDDKRGQIDRRTIIGGAFSASDRMISGMLTVSLPLLLVSSFEATPSVIGSVLAAPLMACALGGYFSGMLCDRIGAIRTRLVGVPLQAGGLTMIILSGGNITFLSLGTLILSVGATLLLPTSLVIGAGHRPKQIDPSVVGGIQSIGQAGHLFGTLLIFFITVVSGAVTNTGVLVVVVIYLAWNTIWLGALSSEFFAVARPAPRVVQGRRLASGPIKGRSALRPGIGGLQTATLTDSHEDQSDPEESIQCHNTSTNASKTARS